MPRDTKNHTKIRQFRLSETTFGRLQAVAAYHDTDMTDVIRMLIGQEHERIARLGGHRKNLEKSPSGS